MLRLTRLLPSIIGGCQEVAQVRDSRRDPRLHVGGYCLPTFGFAKSPRCTFKKRPSIRGVAHRRDTTFLTLRPQVAPMREDRTRIRATGSNVSAALRLTESQLCTIDTVEFIKNDRPNVEFNRNRSVVSRVLPSKSRFCRPTSERIRSSAVRLSNPYSSRNKGAKTASNSCRTSG